MKIVVHGIFLFLFAVIQSTWISGIELFNVIPNLFVVYVIVVGCFCSRVEGAVVGFSFGMMLDMLSGGIWGLFSLLYMVLGFSTAHFCDRVFGQKNIVLALILVLICSWASEFIYYIISFLSVENMSLKYAIINVIFPEGIYNVIITLPVYFIFRKIAKYIYVDKGELIG